MKCIGLKMITLSPVQYFFTPAFGGMRSSDFIGDIALKYAFIRQLWPYELPGLTKSQPTYRDDLKKKDYDFWLTPAISPFLAFGRGNETLFMKTMVRNTMQGIDYNGTNSDPTFKTGSLMYKNFFFTQPIRPGNTFYSYLIIGDTYNDFEIPQAVRVGNNKTGILKVEKTNENFRSVINLYTIMNIMGKSKPVIKNEYSSHLILQYNLKGYYNKDELLDIYGS